MGTIGWLGLKWQERGLEIVGKIGWPRWEQKKKDRQKEGSLITLQISLKMNRSKIQKPDWTNSSQRMDDNIEDCNGGFSGRSSPIARSFLQKFHHHFSKYDYSYQMLAGYIVNTVHERSFKDNRLFKKQYWHSCVSTGLSATTTCKLGFLRWEQQEKSYID